MRDFHGDGRGILEVSNLWSWEKDLGYQTYDFESFVQGLDEEDLERLLRLHLRFVSISFEFSLIYAWPIPF
jgi:hypothetical protein